MGFPENVVEVIENRFITLFPGHAVVSRTLRHLDPAKSIGIFVVDVTPDRENSMQIGQREPTVNRYVYRIQNMIKAGDEVSGRAEFGLDSKAIRGILYRDTNLRVELTTLTETFLGSRESLKGFGVVRQRFLNNELGRGSFVYLAQTDVWVETEIVQL